MILILEQIRGVKNKQVIFFIEGGHLELLTRRPSVKRADR